MDGLWNPYRQHLEELVAAWQVTVLYFSYMCQCISVDLTSKQSSFWILRMRSLKALPLLRSPAGISALPAVLVCRFECPFFLSMPPLPPLISWILLMPRGLTTPWTATVWSLCEAPVYAVDHLEGMNSGPCGFRPKVQVSPFFFRTMKYLKEKPLS